MSLTTPPPAPSRVYPIDMLRMENDGLLELRKSQIVEEKPIPDRAVEEVA